MNRLRLSYDLSRSQSNLLSFSFSQQPRLEQQKKILRKLSVQFLSKCRDYRSYLASSDEEQWATILGSVKHVSLSTKTFWLNVRI